MATKKLFPDTVWTGDSRYADTQVGFESANPSLERVELAPDPLPRKQVPDDLPSADWSGILIVAGVGIIMLLIAAPSQFEWFRSLTGITGWVDFLRHLFG